MGGRNEGKERTNEGKGRKLSKQRGKKGRRALAVFVVFFFPEAAVV